MTAFQALAAGACQGARTARAGHGRAIGLCAAFEQEEIEGLITFYRSPADQAFINKIPVVMQKSMALAQTHMQSLMPKMRAVIDEAIAEEKRKK